MSEVIKRKFRYSWEKKEWSELYRFSTDVVIISPIRRPDGSFNSYTLPRNSPLVDFHRGI